MPLSGPPWPSAHSRPGSDLIGFFSFILSLRLQGVCPPDLELLDLKEVFMDMNSLETREKAFLGFEIRPVLQLWPPPVGVMCLDPVISGAILESLWGAWFLGGLSPPVNRGASPIIASALKRLGPPGGASSTHPSSERGPVPSESSLLGWAACGGLFQIPSAGTFGPFPSFCTSAWSLLGPPL